MFSHSQARVRVLFLLVLLTDLLLFGGFVPVLSLGRFLHISSEVVPYYPISVFIECVLGAMNLLAARHFISIARKGDPLHTELTIYAATISAALVLNIVIIILLLSMWATND